MNLQWLLNSGPALAAVLLFFLVLAAVEAGFALGVRRSKSGSSEDSNSGIVQGAILGLVGLLLAFMFSFGAARYDLRHQLMVKEANAIGTAYLRTDLFPEPSRSELRRIYARYTDVRIAYYKVAPDSAERAQLSAESDALQADLWKKTLARAPADRSPLMALAIVSVNDVIDVSAEQANALVDFVPGQIILLLFAAVTISGFITGYGFGQAGQRDLRYVLAFSVLVSVVSLTILDLSTPERGFIRTTDAALQTFRASLK